METWLNQLYNWLPTGPLYYGLLGVIAFLESLALVGIFIPGSVLIVFAGFLAAHGKGDFPLLATACIAGSIAGDLLSYLLGARMGQRLLNLPLLRKRQDLLRRAEQFFFEHGGKSVFLGRFIGFLRPFIPFVAGSALMPALPFTGFAVVSGVLWGLVYPGLGYLFAASWQLVEVWSGRLSLLFLLLGGLFVLNALFWSKLAPPLIRVAARLWQGLVAAWQRLWQTPAATVWLARHPRLVAWLADRFSLRHPGGFYLTAGFCISLLFAALFIQVSRLVVGEATLTDLDRHIYQLLQPLHHPITNGFFVVLTYLGSAQVILILGALVVCWLLLNNRDFSTLILLVGVGGGELLTFALKFLFSRPRPLPFYPQLSALGASFPSGHAFQAVVFYGLIVYFLLAGIDRLQGRILLLLSGSFLALLIGFSRIYLGVHWFSDVLGGFLLAALWLTFLITTCEARFRYGVFSWRRGWRPITLSPWWRRGILVCAALAALLGLWLTVVPQVSSLVAQGRNPPSTPSSGSGGDHE